MLRRIDVQNRTMAHRVDEKQKNGAHDASPVSVMKLLSCPEPGSPASSAAVRPPGPAIESRGAEQQQENTQEPCAATAEWAAADDAAPAAVEASAAPEKVEAVATDPARESERRRRSSFSSSLRLSKEIRRDEAVAQIAAEAEAAKQAAMEAAVQAAFEAAVKEAMKVAVDAFDSSARADACTTAAGIRVKEMTRRRQADDETVPARQLRRRERLKKLEATHRETVTKLQLAQRSWVSAADSVPRVTRALTAPQIARLVEPMAAAEARSKALAEELPPLSHWLFSC